ncbi:MAG: hypothetical protein V4550_03145 [Gemmatimonadota bacterium]
MNRHRAATAAAVLLLHAALGCAQSPPASATKPATPPVTVADTNASGLIPAGFGTLKQDNIAIKLQLSDVLVKAIPLDENVIRTLSPDSYRALRDLAESKRTAVTRLAAQHGLLRGVLWSVDFFGLAADARFSPLELTITSAGRDFRPVEVLPLTAGFGEQRLQARSTQRAIYLFDDALDVNQPLTVSLGSERSASTDWSSKLREIEKERALVRSRAQTRSATPPPEN